MNFFGRLARNRCKVFLHFLLNGGFVYLSFFVHSLGAFFLLFFLAVVFKLIPQNVNDFVLCAIRSQNCSALGKYTKVLVLNAHTVCLETEVFFDEFFDRNFYNGVLQKVLTLLQIFLSVHFRVAIL